MTLHKTVVDKEVTSHELDELLCSKMIPDIGKTDAGGNAAGSCQGTEKRGFGHAKTSSPLEHIACAVVFREMKRRIRVVEDPVAYGIIEPDGDLDRLCPPLNDGARIISDARMIAIDDRC